MKKIKKIISIILILVLTILPFIPMLNVAAEDEFIITTYGENEEGIRSDLIVNSTTITVTSIGSSDSFSAYKVLDCFYNALTNEITYEFTTDFSLFLNSDLIKDEYPDFSVDDYFALTSDYSAGGSSVVTTSTLNILLSKYAVYVKANNITSVSMSTTDNIATTTVESGSYLIVSNAALGNYIYGVIVANATPIVENGEWVVSAPTIVAKSNSANHAFASFMTSESGDYTEGIFEEKAYQLNQIYTNIIGYNGIIYPTNAINKTTKFEIILDEGIKFEGISKIEVSNGIEKKKLFKVNDDGTIYNDDILIGNIKYENNEIIFDIDNNKYDDNLVFFIRTSLNENAKIGNVGNKIISRFIYANDPYSTSAESYTVVESINIAYTYGLTIKNYGNEDKDVLLNGTVFEVYSDESLNNLLGEVNISNGEGIFRGIADGTYYIKQKKAATGYRMLNDILEITLDTESDDFVVEIINKKLGILPSTGGMGTIIYTVVGLVIIVIASILFIFSRKKNKKETAKETKKAKE